METIIAITLIFYPADAYEPTLSYVSAVADLETCIFMGESIAQDMADNGEEGTLHYFCNEMPQREPAMI